MTEPQIQYAQTKDGVNIAYATVGSGMPLVGMPVYPFSHVEQQWDFFGSLWQPLAETFRLIRYDARGTGLSDRDAIDFSMEAMMRDLEAVVEHADLRSFAVLALTDGVPAAVTYAASRSDRVSHLVICDGWTKYSDYAQTAAYEVEASLREKDWVLFTETYAQVLWPFDDPALARQFAEFLRACTEPEAYRAAQIVLESFDVSALLPSVIAPTLVVHNRNNRWVPMQSGQRIAGGIRDARFVSIDDLTWAPVPELIKEFVGEEAASGLAADDIHTVLFTDVEGSTALTDRLGDAKARDLLREHERITRDALKSHGGSEVKTLGDGFMASFSSATKALECAIAMQRAFGERNDSADEPISVRIGLNAGEPIAEADPGGRGDLFGTAVNMAARIASKAKGGEILVADVVRQLVAGKEFLFSDRGDTELRGFEDPVRVYEVRWHD